MCGRLSRRINRLADRTGWALWFFIADAKYGIVLFAGLLVIAYLDARRRGVFYQNTGFCFNFHRPCAYFALCRSNGNPNVIENFYQRVPPNEELQVLPGDSTETAF